METRVLYKLIEKVILPKYPWIKDFNWTTHFYGGTQYYGLDVYVDPTTDPELTDNESTKLEKDVMSLFRAVGPPSGVYFDSVSTYVKD